MNNEINLYQEQIPVPTKISDHLQQTRDIAFELQLALSKLSREDRNILKRCGYMPRYRKDLQSRCWGFLMSVNRFKKLIEDNSLEDSFKKDQIVNPPLSNFRID